MQNISINTITTNIKNAIPTRNAFDTTKTITGKALQGLAKATTSPTRLLALIGGSASSLYHNQEILGKETKASADKINKTLDKTIALPLLVPSLAFSYLSLKLLGEKSPTLESTYAHANWISSQTTVEAQTNVTNSNELQTLTLPVEGQTNITNSNESQTLTLPVEGRTDTIKADAKIQLIDIPKVSEQSEPNQQIREKALKITGRFTNERVLGLLKAGEMDFATTEELKETKRLAKELAKDPNASLSTKNAMKQVIKQYDEMKEGFEVLAFLSLISRDLRKGDLEEDFHEELGGLVLPENLTKREIDGELVDYDASLNAFEDLMNRARDKDTKDSWKAEIKNIRARVWNAFVETKEVLGADQEIQAVSGSKSSALPLILKTAQLAPQISDKPALIPTGKLLQHNIVPLSGELLRGATPQGINQRALSGMDLQRINVCLGYASQEHFQFDREKELNKIESFNSSLPTMEADFVSVHVAVLRLLKMGLEEEKQLQIRAKLETEIKKHKPIELNSNWSKAAELMGKTCSQPGEPLNFPPQLGQLVAFEDPKTKQLTYGVVAKRLKKDYCTVATRDKNGNLDFIEKELSFFRKVSTEKSGADLINKEPLNDNIKYRLELLFRGSRETLEHTLSLFDTVESYNFSPEEMQFIEHPFPIVWAFVAKETDKVPGLKNILSELYLKGVRKLGEDGLEIMFTGREHVAEMQKLLEPHGVRVASFDAAHYLKRMKNFSKVRKERIEEKQQGT